MPRPESVRRKSGDEATVFGVGADPKPDYFVAARHGAEGAIVEIYPNRKNVFVLRQGFELKAGMSGIFEKNAGRRLWPAFLRDSVVRDIRSRTRL
jgi:hypothetical protein